jgi:hypothetical protein
MLRKLFTDHAVYTKFYIESFLSNLPDSTFIAKRLMDNQKDIGNAVKPIVGTSKGDALIALLTEHIQCAAEVLAHLLAKEDAAMKRSIRSLFRNSDDVATFLNSLNPRKLPLDVVKREFRMHNQHVLNIATLHAKKEYEKEIAEYDAYFNHMMRFSDMLYDALR